MNSQGRILTVFINSKNAKSERRFDSLMSVLDLKEKLSVIVGIAPSAMQIIHKNKSLADEKRLFECSISDFDELFVNSLVSNQMDFEDLSAVEKYEMARETYEERTDSVLHFKKMNKLGRFSEKYKEKQLDESFKYQTCDIPVGSRMMLKPSNGIEMRGRVAYVGLLEGKQGYFVGLELDEPLGKNSGEFMGKQLFQCGKMKGLFVRPDQILIGDYPEIDLFDEDEF